MKIRTLILYNGAREPETMEFESEDRDFILRTIDAHLSAMEFCRPSVNQILVRISAETETEETRISRIYANPWVVQPLLVRENSCNSRQVLASFP